MITDNLVQTRLLTLMISVLHLSGRGLDLYLIIIAGLKYAGVS